MKAGLPFVSLLALARNTRADARASHTPRAFEVMAKAGSGCPSFGGQRAVASDRKQRNSERLSKHLSLSIEAPGFKSVTSPQPPWARRFVAAPSSTLSTGIGRRAACTSSVGMLRHPNPRLGCGSKSVA